MKRNRVLWLLVFVAVISLGLLLVTRETRPWDEEPTFEIAGCKRDEAQERRVLEASERYFDELHPLVLERAQWLLRISSSCLGFETRLTSGYRSDEEQTKLYEQGRTTPGNIVTRARAGESYHNYGLAVDFVIIHEGRADYDVEADRNGNGRSDWEEIGELGKALGFEWGGDWESFPDYPHLQMSFDYTIRELKKGKRPDLDVWIPLADTIQPLVD